MGDRDRDDDRPERPVYCGNYEYSMPENDIRRLFEEFGDVERIDMKQGFCFVYMYRQKDADRAIRNLQGQEVGYKRRRLNVEYAKTKDADRKRDTKPSSSLFVVNFDVGRVREKDLERFFGQYGRLRRVEIKKSFAFIQFEEQADAEYAMSKTNGTEMDGRTITVEYVQNENPDAARERGWGGDDRGGRGGYDRDRYDDRRGGGRDRYDDRDRDRGRYDDRDRDRGRGYERSRSPPRRARSYSRSRSRSPR